VTVATTRPETMLGDTAVAVNSQDPRYGHLHGKEVILPLMNRRIPIICDDVLVDPQFGTGAVKVTPAHDLNDFEAGQRHSLPQIVVIGNDAKMSAEAGAYAGLDRYEARTRVVADLEAQGLLEKVEEYSYQIGEHDRCHTVLEPLLSEQWFVRMEELARLALTVLQDDRLEISYHPDRFRRYTLDWLENLRDWNISRQIWWGHRIPVYYCTSCKHTMVQMDPPASCSKCGGPVQQDPDTLDTWFSSALWPFAVMGWPDQDEFSGFVAQGVYPTALMITARDILYLWIVRMIMTSLEFTSEIPFRQVLVHPTVLNLEGRRMSKSLGTGIDPLELIADYGSDATRFSLLYQCASDQDIRFGEERTEMARNFCNKIWNASRFVLMNLGDDFAPNERAPERVKAEGSLAERWILSRYGEMLSAVTSALGRYEMADAARALHTFFWSEFCDWFVEMSKPALKTAGADGEHAKQTLHYILEGTLRALHPFMPFITEEIWQKMPGAGESIMVSAWPEPEASWRDDAAEKQMETLMAVVVAARKRRAERDREIQPADRASVSVYAQDERTRRVIEENRETVGRLTGGMGVSVIAERPPEGMIVEVIYCFGEPAWVAVPVHMDETHYVRQKARLEKDSARLGEEEEALTRKLQNAEFRSRAPRQVVEKAESRLREVAERRKALEEQLLGIDRALGEQKAR
jgi:valyl-tRNA synthetase